MKNKLITSILIGSMASVLVGCSSEGGGGSTAAALNPVNPIIVTPVSPVVPVIETTDTATPETPAVVDVTETVVVTPIEEPIFVEEPVLVEEPETTEEPEATDEDLQIEGSCSNKKSVTLVWYDSRKAHSQKSHVLKCVNDKFKARLKVHKGASKWIVYEVFAL